MPVRRWARSHAWGRRRRRDAPASPISTRSSRRQPLPGVSVVVPAFNAADTLPDALSSLQAQEGPAWEAIVVDDGSTDATAEVVTGFAGRDPRITLVRVPRGGHGAARNAGIRIARFEWLLFLDADDWILPPLLRRLTEAASAGAFDAVYSGCARVAPDGRLLEEPVRGEGEDLFSLLGRSCVFAIHSCIVRRDLVEEVGGFDPGLRTCRTPAAWEELWPDCACRIQDFLLALEDQAAAPGLAQRAGTALERLVLQQSEAPRPRTRGTTHAVRVEVTEAVPDVCAPPGVERLLCEVEAEGERLGVVQLPVCDGFVPGAVISDAIAGELAWPLLGRFFAATVYREVAPRRRGGGARFPRGLFRRGETAVDEGPLKGAHAHATIGWEVFLQELWARPGWPASRFYKPRWSRERGTPRRCQAGRTTVEVSEELPEIVAAGGEVEVELRIGGTSLGYLGVRTRGGRVRVPQLRAALTSAWGFELCRAAVREALLGRPLNAPGTLRERLAEAAAQQCVSNAPAGCGGS